MPYFYFQLNSYSASFDTMPPGVGGLLILAITITIYPFALVFELIQDYGFLRLFDLDIVKNPIKILIGFSYVCCFVGYEIVNIYSWWFGLLFLLNPILIRLILVFVNDLYLGDKTK